MEMENDNNIDADFQGVIETINVEIHENEKVITESKDDINEKYEIQTSSNSNQKKYRLKKLETGKNCMDQEFHKNSGVS